MALCRDCQPAKIPLRKSYFHGVSMSPLVSDTLGDVLDDAARELPDHTVFRVPEFQSQITLQELKQRADIISRALLANGLKHGDMVLLIGVTDVEFIVLFYAVTQIGLVFLFPAIDDPPVKDTEIYCETGPKAIFVGRAYSEASMKVVQQHFGSSCQQAELSIPVVMVNTENRKDGTMSYSDFIETGLQVKDLQTAIKEVSADDIAILFPSSGSSSEKHKLTCITHHSIVNMVRFCRQRFCPHRTPEVIGFLSSIVDDANPVIQIVAAVYERNVAVMAPPSLNFTSSDIFMSFIQNERITWYCGLPLEVINAINSPLRGQYDLSSLRGVTLLGQATSPEMKQKILSVFPESLTVFGASEALAGLSTSAVWSTVEQRLFSSGYPFPHCEVKVVNDKDQIVPVGRQGELCIRGWPVMKQYLHDNEMTSSAKAAEKNGWYHYGDICSMDETGHVTYYGRKSECVRFKHFSDTVYPEKILRVVEGDEKVKLAKVVGIPCDEKGDEICLCVEPMPNQTLSEEYLKRLMEEHLVANMRPDYYFIFDEFPRSGARKKVAYSQLRLEVKKRISEIKGHRPY